MSDAKLGAGKRQRMRNQLRHARDARQYRRLLAVLECDQGKSVNDVAELLGVSRQSVYNWIARAHRNDAAALSDAPRSGRPAKAGYVFDTLLPILLMLSPEQFGYPATYWTIPLLQDQLWRNTEDKYSASCLACQSAASCWLRTRQIYCCFRRYERCGGSVESQHEYY